MTFTIYPAIDLHQGQVVRLRQGDPAAQTTYSADPVAVARAWAAAGATWLHVVNLDGAFSRLNLNLNVNLTCLHEIHATVTTPIQFGGGLRTVDDIALALKFGAMRVVLGTAAVRQPDVVAQAIQRFGAEQVAVGIDARDGWVATHGWQETSALTAEMVARRMADLGVRNIIFTDIARDGMLNGVNVTATAALARASGLRVIASGGVASLADIRALKDQAEAGIEGVIIGQALYTGAIDLAEALATG